VHELRVIATALALFAAMALAAFLGRRQRVGAIILALLSVVWLSCDREFEGPVLVAISEGHGVVLSDLVAIAGLVLAVWLWRRAR
jgi:hypothetical protein